MQAGEEKKIATLGDVLDQDHKKAYYAPLDHIIRPHAVIELRFFMAEGGRLKAKLEAREWEPDLVYAWEAFMDECRGFFLELQRERERADAVAPLVADLSQLALRGKSVAVIL